MTYKDPQRAWLLVGLWCVSLLGTVSASPQVGRLHRAAESTVQLFNIRCFEGRAPNSYTKRDLHPQLFVGDIALTNSQLQVIVPQFPAYQLAREANLVCVSRPSARQVDPLFIPCPFLHGPQKNIKVKWTFRPASPDAIQYAATGRLITLPWRASNKRLYIRGLTDADRGTYTCNATRGRKVWEEQWEIGKIKNDWMFTWKGDNGDRKAYKISHSTGEVIVMPHASRTWLQAKLIHANNFNFL
ncbi:hypothetical protein BIW11_08466 [Tropilaelaps mercedesae]|uniref:Ig-like domain-containing protein n=1 Tax=Tropilaelaps mercedesae TaxID=418985 RepID=A0A1V9XPF4_9ACAR|nr:hypothetical protein BIW11_08466 [Tropilaelaps mercedesae]